MTKLIALPHVGRQEDRALEVQTPDGYVIRIGSQAQVGWLGSLLECAFSKMARTFLRHIRVKSKDELKTRILKGIAEINDSPVVFRWNKFDLGIV